MRITGFKTFLCSYTFPEEKSWWGGRWDLDVKGVRFNAVILQVNTDEGISGLGEATPWGDCPGMASAIYDLESRFIGRDPFDVEHLENSLRHLAVLATAEKPAQPGAGVLDGI